MNTTQSPIVLVPGFWLGAWAWDEVAAALRDDGHEVTALTLPGLESTDADRSSAHVRRPCRRDLRRGDGSGPSGRARRAQCRPGSPATPRSDRIPQSIAAMVYVDSAPGEGRPGSRVRRRREAPGVGGGRRGGEPRRAQPRAAGDVPAAGRPGTRWNPSAKAPSLRTTRAGTSRARSSARVSPPSSTRTLPKEGYSFLAGLPRAERRDLGRPADEPLADAVASAGARRDHRRRREGRAHGLTTLRV